MLLQEIAALKEAVEQNEVEELRLDIAVLREELRLEEAIEQNDVEELRLEVAALSDSVDRGFNKIALKSILAPYKVSDMVRTKRLDIVNGDDEVLISAVGNLDENGGYIVVYNKTGEGVVELRIDDYGNGEVGAFNRKGKGRVLDSK